MLRLLFSKTGNAVWISHLDTMRLFQRAFKRSGFHLKHTQGFNPRPSVSIALPLSVGVESDCELLDFELEDEGVSCADIKEKLNASLIEGVHVIDVYEQGQKLKYLRYLQCEVDLTYDEGISVVSENAIRNLFNSAELFVDKKGKNGITTQNIIPMIRDISIVRLNEKILRINTVICCQEPSLNPSQLNAAIVKYLPECTPSFTKCYRRELFDMNNQVFR
jgi:radical SAM-linked protein